jgi:hypothetical protein
VRLRVVMRLDASLTSLGKQSASTPGANRAAQVAEIGGAIFAVFGNSSGTQFARFDRPLTTAPTVTPLPFTQQGAVGIAPRGATLGIAVITHPFTLGLNTSFLEVDQSGQTVRSAQLLGSNTMGALVESVASIVATASGWAIGWEDFTSNYYDAKVSLLDCP